MEKLLLITLVLSNVAVSETIYQCKDNWGKTNFQDKPCKSTDNLVKKNKSKGVSSRSNSNHSMWVEPNYVDTQYSALFKSISIEKASTSDPIQKSIPFGWKPYYVKAKVEDVYKGNLVKGDILSLLVYLTPPFKDGEDKLNNEFILSFCRSKGGINYTSRDFLVTSPTPSNLSKFIDVRENGTGYKGSGDCTGNYPALNPDTHN